MRSKFVIIVLFILLVPLLIAPSDSSLSITRDASAADACSGDLEPVRWNETLQRSALVPHYNPYDDWWGFLDYEDDGRGKKNNRNSDNDDSNQQEEQAVDMSLSPEPSWMYESTYSRNGPSLEPLVSNHHSTLLVGNDSVGAIKVNLSANHRTTVCITLQD